MKWPAVVFGSVLITAITGVVDDGAHAFCPHQRPWLPRIGVVLQHQAHEQLCIDNAVPCTTVSRGELQTTIRATLDEFFDRSGARIRLDYEGLCYMDPPFNTQLCGNDELPPGRIVIRAKDCAAFGFANNFDTDGDGFSDQGFAEICTVSVNGNNVFSSYPGAPDANVSIQGILLHELSHTIGFAHPDECGEVAGSSILQGHNSPHPTRYDINALQELYGLRAGQSMESKVASFIFPFRWFDSTVLAFGDSALSGFSACDNATVGGVRVAFSHQTQRLIGVMTFGPAQSTTVIPSFLPGNVVITHARPGIACEDFERVRVFFTMEVSIAEQSVFFVQSGDGALTWTPPALADDLTVRTHGGVEATFDPATGFYVYTHRGDRSRVLTKVMSTGSRIVGYPRPPDESVCLLKDGGIAAAAGQGFGLSLGTTDCWRASDIPSITCGEPASLGEYNCLLVWANTDWYRQMMFAPSKVVPEANGGHRLELHSVRMSGYTSFGGPSVALELGLNSPWRVAVHSGGDTAQTMRKAIDPAASWEHTGPMVFKDKMVSPSLGSSSTNFFFIQLPFTRAFTTSR